MFKITCSKCGGNTGGPDTFSHGLMAGITWEYSFWAVLLPASLSLASAWNTSKSDLRTETKLFLVPMSLSMLFYKKKRPKVINMQYYTILNSHYLDNIHNNNYIKHTNFGS